MVEALPVETFEALLVVASWIGEVLDDEPPYRLDVLLRRAGRVLVPARARARCRRVDRQPAPSASIGGRPAPGVEAVRDVWITHLNQLDWE